MLRSWNNPIPMTSHTHVFGGQLAAAHRRGVGHRQRVSDPLRVDRRAEPFETRRALASAHHKDGLPHLHRPTYSGGDQVLPVGKDPEGDHLRVNLSDGLALQTGDSPRSRPISPPTFCNEDGTESSAGTRSA